MIERGKAYAWEENGAFFLSRLPYDPNKRQPANWYETRDELAAEARARKLTVVWHTNPS